jgi:CHAT domain-containing protein
MSPCFWLLFFSLLSPAAAANSARESLKERDALRVQAEKLQDDGKLADARAAVQKALAIERKLLGAQHADVAVTLSLLARIAEEQRDCPTARSARQNALTIHNHHGGKSDWRTVDARVALAHLERLAALNPQQAERLVNARKLRAQAEEFLLKSDYARVEPLVRRYSELLRDLFGEEDPDYAMAVNDLGVIAQDTGDRLQAEKCFRRSLEIYRKVIGENHPEYATSLHNLADLYREDGDLHRAEPLFLRALAIHRETRGQSDEGYTQMLESLARVYWAREEFDRARQLLEEARRIFKQVTGEESYALIHNLGGVYRDMGDFAKAEQLLIQTGQSGAPEWPIPGSRAYHLGILYYLRGNDVLAESTLREALHTTLKHLEWTFTTQSERRQLALARHLRQRLDTYISLAVRAGLPAENAYAEILAWKGSVFARQRWLRLEQMQKQTDPETARKFEELEKTISELARLAVAPPDPKDSVSRQRRMEELAHRQDDLESELAQRNSDFSSQRALTRQTPRQIQESLPPGVSLVDFLEFSFMTANPRGRGKPVSEKHLAAVIVSQDRPIRLRDLGPMQPIARAIDGWRAAVLDEARANTAAEPAAAEELRRLLWERLERDLVGSRALLVSPDGDLARFPWGALPGHEPGTYLLEELPTVTVTVPQLLPQLLRGDQHRVAPASESSSLVLVGDVDFGANAAPAMVAAGPSEEIRLAIRGNDRLQFGPLPGSASESQAVRAAFTQAFPGGTVAYLHGPEATRDALRQHARGCRYLHLATHGFFAPPQLRSALATTGPDSAPSVYHPGLLSGLALAGANRLPDVASSTASTDGILTALDVAEMNLNSTDLVVLSACETGLGKAAGGEGLLGLQRAFQMAGARAVVASLWKVDDDATRRLMTEFYDRLWRNRTGTLEALRRAQIALLHSEATASMERSPGKPEAMARPGRRSQMPTRLWAAWTLSGIPDRATLEGVASGSAPDASVAAVTNAGGASASVLAAGGALVVALVAVIIWAACRRS